MSAALSSNLKSYAMSLTVDSTHPKRVLRTGLEPGWATAGSLKSGRIKRVLEGRVPALTRVRDLEQVLNSKSQFSFDNFFFKSSQV